MGQDTAYEVPFKGKRFWIWGDTNTPTYALGLYQTPGGTSRAEADREVRTADQAGVRLFPQQGGRRAQHLRDERLRAHVDQRAPSHCLIARDRFISFPRTRKLSATATCHLTTSASPSGTKDAEFRFRPDSLDEESGKPLRDILIPNGHPFYAKDASGKDWLYLGEGLPSFKCPATYEAWKDRFHAVKVENPANSKPSTAARSTCRPGLWHGTRTAKNTSPSSRKA